MVLVVKFFFFGKAIGREFKSRTAHAFKLNAI